MRRSLGPALWSVPYYLSHELLTGKSHEHFDMGLQVAAAGDGCLNSNGIRIRIRPIVKVDLIAPASHKIIWLWFGGINIRCRRAASISYLGRVEADGAVLCTYTAGTGRSTTLCTLSLKKKATKMVQPFIISIFMGLFNYIHCNFNFNTTSTI